MKRQTVICCVLLVSIFVGTVALTSAQERPIHSAESLRQEQLNLTIYTDSTVLVQDVRTFDLQEGLNEVSFAGIAPDIDLSSLSFSSPEAEVRILEQRLERPQAFDLSRLMEANLGQAVTVTTLEELTYSGTLLYLQSNNLIVIQQEDGTLVNLGINQLVSYNLPILPTMSATSPGLTLLVESPQAGPQPLVITFLAGGLAWSVDYNLLLADDRRSVVLTGWVRLDNYSDASYQNAQVTLASGSFNQLSYVSQSTDLAYSATATPVPTMTSTPPASFGDPYAAPIAQPSNFFYRLAQPINLLAQDSTRVQLLDEAGVDATNVYVYDVSPRIFGYAGFNTDPSYGQSGDSTVLNFLSFSAPPDQPFAAGSLRLYQQEDADSAALIGISQLPAVDPSQEIQIFLESSSEITGERRQTGYQALSADAIQEDYEIRLRNNSEQAVTILVPERMTRSTAWEVIASNTPFEQPNAFGIEFEVEVPAGGESVINYSVMYRRQ